MAKQTRKVNTIKNGTIELVLLLLLQTNKKYGYLDFEQVKVGVRRTRVYYSITESGRLRLKNLLQEYDTITSAIDTIISCVSQVDNKNGED